MKKMLREALKQVEDFDSVIVNTWDRPINKFCPINVFSFSEAESFYDKVIPDYIFESWEECGIDDYRETINEIKKVWEKKWLKKMIWWIWRFKTSKSRFKLAKLADKYPEYFDIKDSSNPDTKRLSHWDLVRNYDCLIDVEWRWYSWRTKLLFFSWRPLFIQERKWIDYALKYAIPWKHYILVKHDFSDLREKFEEYLRNPEKFEKIWKAWQKFAEDKLTKESALNEIKQSFTGLSFSRLNIVYILRFIFYRIICKIIEMFFLLIRRIRENIFE